MPSSDRESDFRRVLYGMLVVVVVAVVAAMMSTGDAMRRVLQAEDEAMGGGQ